MLSKAGAHAASRSTFFSKCLMTVLLAVLVGVAAVFVFFAFMRQSHPGDRPAQKTEAVTCPNVQAV